MNLLKKIIKVLNKKDNKEKEFHTEIIIKYKNIISVEDIISSSFSKFLGNTLIGSEASYFSLNTKQLGTGKIIGMYLNEESKLILIIGVGNKIETVDSDTTIIYFKELKRPVVSLSSMFCSIEKFCKGYCILDCNKDCPLYCFKKICI